MHPENQGVSNIIRLKAFRYFIKQTAIPNEWKAL